MPRCFHLLLLYTWGLGEIFTQLLTQVALPDSMLSMAIQIPQTALRKTVTPVIFIVDTS
jgi:hypothetical protein